MDNLCVLLCTLSRVEGKEAIAKLEEMTLIKKKNYIKRNAQRQHPKLQPCTLPLKIVAFLLAHTLETFQTKNLLEKKKNEENPKKCLR